MIKGLLILAIVIFALNAVYQVTAPLIKNTMIEGKMVDVAGNHGLKSAGEVQVEIMDYIRDKGIDLDESQLIVHQTDDGRIHLAARYETTGTFWKYSRSYVFFPASDAKARLYWNQRDKTY